MKNFLEEISDIRVGFPFRSRLENDPAGNVAVVQMKDLEEDRLITNELVRIRMPDLKEKHLLEKNDIILRTRGMNHTAVLVSESLENTIVAAPLMPLRVKTPRILPSYLLWFINHPDTQKHLASHAKGTSVQMISKDVLMELEIPLPPIDKQEVIIRIAALAAEEQRLLRSIADKSQMVLGRRLIQYSLQSKEDRSMAKTRHVVPSPDRGWDNKKGGAQRATSHHQTKQDAVDAARQQSQKEGSELKIHNKDGKISQSDSHGHDPRNTKG